MSQPPGGPQFDGESSAGEPDDSAARSEPVEPDPDLTRNDSSPPQEEPAPGSQPEAAGGQQPPWWSQGQAPPPPAGGQVPYGQQPPPYPAPYQQQTPSPWGYAQQGPPANAPGWSRPAAPATPGGRDRLLPHLVWEGVLAVIAIVLLVGTAALTPHQNVNLALDQAGYAGLLACGLAFSLRTGSPNLAVGFIVFFSTTTSAYLISTHDWSKPAAFFVAVLLSTLIGLVLGILVAVLSVPSWAVTLGAGAVIQAIVLAFSRNPIIPVHFTSSYPTALWYGLFFVLSVGGGALWLVPAVRRPLSAVREPGDPARWLGLRTGVGAIVGLTGSSFLAGLAAVPLLMRVQSSVTGTTADITFALAAALLGGVSLFGRRAGVFGTFLAVTILTVVQTLIIYNGFAAWVTILVTGLAALAGVGVSRALESVTGALDRTRPAPFTPQPPGPPGPMASGGVGRP